MRSGWGLVLHHHGRTMNSTFESLAGNVYCLLRDATLVFCAWECKILTQHLMRIVRYFAFILLLAGSGETHIEDNQTAYLRAGTTRKRPVRFVQRHVVFLD